METWVSAIAGGTPMAAPTGVTNVAPVDGATDIENGMMVSWTYDDAAVEEYQLTLGTTYPPATVVMPWTAAGATGDSYELMNLDPNLQYFWQVAVRNNVGETLGDVWGFTTTISVPTNVVAADYELFVGDASRVELG